MRGPPSIASPSGAAPKDDMPSLPAHLDTWLTRWRPILPLLAAEAVVWLGFGAMLPVLPLYFRDHGVDLALLGVVIAAWPAARIFTEPLFGWLADRTRRVPLMLVGLVVTGLAVALPLVFVGPAAFLVLRAIAGLGSAIYDPAARGYVVDATPPERRGEAFGLYGAAQMAGFLIGPALGGLLSALVGQVEVVFIVCAVASWLAALAVGLAVHEMPKTAARVRLPAPGRAGLPADDPVVAGGPLEDRPTVPQPTAAGPETTGTSDVAASAGPTVAPVGRLWNRLLLAAVILQVGSFYAGGTYEVIWSLYMESRGAGLDLIGLTFALFALPVLLLSPFGGRQVDRRGPLAFVVAGALVTAACGIAYTVVPTPLLMAPIVLVEATGFAFLSPALFAVVAAGSPAGRSSTAQGIFGAAGTIGTIVASVTAGYLAQADLRLPFWIFSVVMVASLGASLLVGGVAMSRLGPARREPRRPPEAVPA